MKICLTLDDVIRAKTKQFGKIYKRYRKPDIDLDSLEVESNDMSKVFEFADKADYQKFVYEDYPFEIFGEASTVEKMVDKKLNLWHLSLDDEDEIDDKIDLMLANPMEFNGSIGYTCFFLSKIATRIREIYFPVDTLDIWNKCDVLITADPKLIENKPEGKKCVKISMPYNEDLQADFEYESLMCLLEDNEFIKKITNERDNN